MIQIHAYADDDSGFARPAADAFDQNAADLAAVDQNVVRPFDVNAIDAMPDHRFGDRNGSHQTEQWNFCG